MPTLASGRLHCDMKHECEEPVTYLDDHGFVYCTGHGKQRQYDMRCRKLRPHELRRLQAGKPLGHY